jgi:hypothetical protein
MLCLLRVACRPLHGACCLDVVLLHATCRPLHFACCALHEVCCLLHSFRWCSHLSCTLSLACRLRHCGLLDRVCCTLSVVCFPVAPLPHVPWCVLSVAGPRRISSGTCSALRVVCCILHDACSRSHRVSCVLPDPSCMPYVACCRTRVLCCFLSMPIPFWHVVCCMSSVATLQRDTAPLHTKRIAAALAIERLSGRQDPLKTEVCV